MRDTSPTSDRAHIVSMVSRIAIAALFLSAAVMKAYDAPMFRNVIGDLITAWWPSEQGIPEVVRYPGVAIVTTAVITWEVVIGTMLLLPSFVRVGLRIASATLIFFTLTLISMFFLSDPPSCGCLGGAGTSSSNATTDIAVGIVRNIALIVMAIWSFRHLPAGQTSSREIVTDLQCA